MLTAELCRPGAELELFELFSLLSLLEFEDVNTFDFSFSRLNIVCGKLFCNAYLSNIKMPLPAYLQGAFAMADFSGNSQLAQHKLELNANCFSWGGHQLYP